MQYHLIEPNNNNKINHIINNIPSHQYFIDFEWNHDILFDNISLTNRYNIIYYRYPIPLFNNIPIINDIKQGKIGDCYFLTALSLLTKTPHIINDLFIDYGYKGLYGIKLFHKGNRMIEIIDNQIPSFKTKYGHQPLFAYKKNNVSWVILLEKLWAKFNKGYQYINIGSVSDVLNIFTGSYHFYLDIKLSSINELWNILHFYHHNNSYVYTFGIVKHDNINLIDNHSYGIIDLYMKDNQKFILLHNPWSFYTMKSKYNINDLKDDKENGLFWLNFDEYYSLFKHICINQIPDKKYFNSTIHDSFKLDNWIDKYLLDIDNTMANKLYMNFSTYNLNHTIKLEILDYDTNKSIITSYNTKLIESLQILSYTKKYLIIITNIKQIENLQYWITIYSPTKYNYIKC